MLQRKLMSLKIGRSKLLEYILHLNTCFVTSIIENLLFSHTCRMFFKVFLKPFYILLNIHSYFKGCSTGKDNKYMG